MTVAQTTAVPVALGSGPGHAADWDDLVARSCNGTFLHSRRFMSYHEDRFADRSVVLQGRHGRLVGVFPAAEDLTEPGTVVSHPGLTYGGIVHDDSVRGEQVVAALTGIADHYRDLGYRRLRYKCVPAIYHSRPAEDDRYALFRLAAIRYRSDLSAAICLSCRGPMSQRRKRSRAQAMAAGVATTLDWAQIADFWEILELNLAHRHGVAPVHSLAEIRLLHQRFPAEIQLITAQIGTELVGGTVLFSAGPVLHMQYTATTSRGRETAATDLVMEHAIELGRSLGCRYFDFGASTLDQGQVLDEGLYQYKTSFGAGGVTYDHYELDLA